VTLMDGDIISPANCVRQPFSSAEIGLAKAVVMISRLNLFWGLDWTAIPEFLSAQSKISGFDVVIGCVDTRAAWCRRVTSFYGQVTESRPSGRFKGRAVLALRLDSFELNGQTHEIRACRSTRASGAHKKHHFLWIGGGRAVERP
jgi:hypothetical protein